MIKRLLLVFVFAAAAPSHASSVPEGDLPFDFGVGDYFSQNLIIDSYYAGNELRARFTYRLQDVSGFNSQALDGWLHLDVAQTYDLNQDEHEIRIGLTDVNPQDVIGGAFYTTFLGNDLPEYFSWYVATDGLVASSATTQRGEFPDQDVTGNLSFSPGNPDAYEVDAGVFLCLECGFDLTLNFLFMDFSDGTLALNFLDDRYGVLLANDFFNGSEPYGYDLNLTARPIPVPAAWLLLGSALALLTRRRA